MERRAITVQGTVQGVGFRPFVYTLALRYSLRGFVKNQSGSVLIEVEGPEESLNQFLIELARDPPPLAQIDRLSWQRQSPHGDSQFLIATSDADRTGPVFISPDVATCQDCLAELFTKANRRYLYPFLNCTNCGPRLTIIKGAPYDRGRTTMAKFPMCAACRAEYEDPSNRRFHAQPTACPVCGPQLELVRHDGTRSRSAALEEFAAALCAGQIGAAKGLGGYHLVCDASNENAVQELRRRKHRDEKPFALMVSDVEAAQRLCTVLPDESRLLLSSRRPIVLLSKRPDAEIVEAVAPGNPFLGVMLPYTPLHHLLLRAVGDVPLVMTSGNRSDEPIAYEDEDAIQRLAKIADLFLIHDRPIHVRCDDSVTRIVSDSELPLRRSRGYAPQPIALPVVCSRPILAVGGQLKGTFALGRDSHAFLSHHLGDLDHYEAFRAFEKDILLYQQLFGIQPELIAHDLHPDYASTRYAQNRGEPLLAVQHHHAHMASCMAEHGLVNPVIGVTLDGTGYGTDGTVWGGEFLVGDYRQFQRAAHLRCVGMPGGDQAIREPWRMALSHLLDAQAGRKLLEDRIAPIGLRTCIAMLERKLNSPMTSSAGRLFDAVASLAGLRDRVSFEGQAAMQMEWLATATQAEGSYPFDVSEDAVFVIDTRPLIRSVEQEARQGTAGSIIARRFHTTLVDIINVVCKRIRDKTGLDQVVLSGGVFLNALLTSEVGARLAEAGFRVYRHRLVPPNDGGLSLGQLAIAAC